MNDSLVLEPSLPPGVTSVTQEFPARFGDQSLFFTLSGTPPPPTPPSPPPPPPPPPAPPPPPFNCSVFNCNCTDICDYYGIVDGQGFGCAPVEAQAFWTAHHCSCSAKEGVRMSSHCQHPLLTKDHGVMLNIMLCPRRVCSVAVLRDRVHQTNQRLPVPQARHPPAAFALHVLRERNNGGGGPAQVPPKGEV